MAAATVVLALFATSCVAPPETPDGYQLSSRLVTGGIQLNWTDPGSSPAGFDLEVMRVRPDGGPWEPLGHSTTNSFTDTDAVNRTTYLYRVRSAAGSGQAAGTWSKPVRTTYVELVLPVVRIDTAGGAPIVSKDDYLNAQLAIDPNGSGHPAFNASMRVKGRGNTTWAFPKKPYKIKLDSKASIFGMPKAKDWVLLANYNDRSQLRTWTAQSMGDLTSLAWTPSSVHVELVLNGKYVGVYQLTEQVEVDSNRVDITEMEPEDTTGEAVTGGYLLEIDERLEENSEPGFRTTRRKPIVIKDPEPANAAQFNYIRQYVQDFENALFGPQRSDPDTGYQAYLDLDSYVDWYIVEELLKNQDANFSSAYIHKERSEKLRFGPLWDFDLSMGTTKGIVPTDPEQWWVNQPNVPWTNQIGADPAFHTRLNQRWDAIKSDVDQLPQQIIDLGTTLEEAVANDAAQWDYTVETNDTAAFLADWLTTRTAWFDTQIDALVAP
ncbi:MAG: CotH kinase family protein [Microthrixaceae bacterium]|nr:CotH kinase family protein [Microthrixaceae bacterium]